MFMILSQLLVLIWEEHDDLSDYKLSERNENSFARLIKIPQSLARSYIYPAKNRRQPSVTCERQKYTQNEAVGRVMGG